jgi:hypothetical protein
MAFLDQIIAFLNTALGSASVVAVVIEFALRLFPSTKPLGIMHLVAAGVRKLAQVFTAAADLLDKVLPQNVKPSEPPQA